MIPITHVPVTSVAKGIHRLGPLETGHRSGPTSPYVVVGNDRAMVAEPGQDGQVPGIIEGLKVLGVDIDAVEYVWASHIHLYHIQGLSVLLKELPKAKFLVHPRGAAHVIEPTRLMESTRQIWDVENTPEERGTKCYGPYLAIPREKVISVEDNQVIDLGGKQMQIIYAPGHAPHHMGLFDRETRALFAGDGVMHAEAGRVRGHHDIRPPYFDLEKFLQTVARYRSLNPSMLLIHSRGGAYFSVEDTLRWAEEDHLAIERICRDGMKRGLSFKEIVQKVDEYSGAVGSQPSAERRGSPEFSSGGLAGMFAYINRKDPSLELPKNLTRKMRGE